VRSTLLRFSVFGDDHYELRREVETSVRRFLSPATGDGDLQDEDDDEGGVKGFDYGYEMSVSEIDDDFSEFLYQADVTVRIRDV